MRSAQRIALILVVSVAGTDVSGRKAVAQEPPTLEEIIQGIELTEKNLFESQSLFIRYERTKTEDLIPKAASGGLLPAEWILVYKENKWFNQRRFTHPFKTKEFVVEGKPKTIVMKERFLLDWQQEWASALVSEFENGGNIFGGLYYTRNLSLDAPKFVAKSAAKNIADLRKMPALQDDLALPFLPEFLRENKRQYLISPSPEKVDGTPCWLVEWPGMDRFWVDPQRGFAIPRRQYCWAPGKPAKFEFRNRDYRQVKPGLWLPFTQLEDKYASIIADKEAIWGKVVTRSEYRVHAMEFDGVSDDFFNVSLPAGTKVSDLSRNFNYQVAASTDADPFSEAIAQAKSRKATTTLIWSLASVFAAMIVAAVGFVFIKRWRRILRRGVDSNRGQS